MKKAFTLIEIVMTIVVIGIVLTMVSNMGNGFTDRVRFANAKEKLSSSVQNIIQEATTTNTVRVTTWQVKYGTITLSIAPGTWSKINVMYTSWELLTPFSRQVALDRGIISTSGFSLQLTPYAIGCTIGSGDSLRLTSYENTKLKACYKLQPDTCKLKEVTCP